LSWNVSRETLGWKTDIIFNEAVFKTTPVLFAFSEAALHGLD
jgi:hypothetical protein